MEKKIDFYKIYVQAHNNAVDLLSEANILFESKKYARAYFLAYTGLEEVAKSQLSADVFTKFIPESEFLKSYCEHKNKINSIQWAHSDASSYPYNQMWLGPDIDDVVKISPEKPSWKMRQKSLYVDFIGDAVFGPMESILEGDAIEIIHILDTALNRIRESEENSERIGTKGFLK